MSTAVSTEARVARVEVSDETITAHLVDGRVISVPLAWSWRLSDATPAQRANWRLIGDGTECTGRTLTKTSVPKACRRNTGSPAHTRGAPAHRLRSTKPANLTGACSRRAESDEWPRAADARTLGGQDGRTKYD
jgi:hypothetical protein